MICPGGQGDVSVYKNLMFMSVEMMLNSANLNLIAFWRYSPHPELLTGMMFAVFSIAVAAAEAAVPVRESVRGACEILGLDPLYVANEGKLVAIVAALIRPQTTISGVVHFLAPLPLERGIVAAVDRELATLDVQDGVDRLVKEIAVVADHDHGARIVRQMVFKPQRAFEIEIVGRFVE